MITTGNSTPEEMTVKRINLTGITTIEATNNGQAWLAILTTDYD